MLVPNKMKHVICTGNVGVDQYNELLALAPNVHVVAGDYEDPTLTFPECQVLQVGHFRIGIMHGHQILPHGSKEAMARMRRKLGVDIFISGFTHQNEVSLQEGFYYINPVRMRLYHTTRTRSCFAYLLLLVISSLGLHHGSLYGANRHRHTIVRIACDSRE